MNEATHLVFRAGIPHLCRPSAFRDFGDIPDCDDPDNSKPEQPRWRLAWCEGEQGAFVCWDDEPDMVISLLEIVEKELGR